MSENTRDDIVVSFKAHTGYDSPLVAVKGATAEEVAEKIDGLSEAGLFAKVASADEELKAVYKPIQKASAVPPAPPAGNGGGSGMPPAPSAPAPGAAPNCAHGPRVWKAGTSKAGKPYKMWACTAPRDQACPAVWA